MSEKTSTAHFDRHETSENLRKLLQQIFTLLKEKIKRIFVLLSVIGKQRKSGKKVSLILSHWHKLFEEHQESTQRIYGLIEKAIGKQKIPDVTISKVSYPEAGALSAKREYLRVQRKDHIFDICAAPFGDAFFVSWWLGQPKTLFWLFAFIIVVSLLIIGLLIGLTWWIPLGIGLVIVGLWKLSLRPTYYRLDTALMFQDSVHSVVLEVIDTITEGKGLRVLSEMEKKPIMSDLFKRKF
jgi:hypothetical protein